MKVRVLLFAEAKSVVGESALSLTLPENASVEQLRQELSRKLPQLIPLLSRSAIAVNQRIADDRTALCDEDEIAWVPPVSGG